jgi:hypothetical protein
VGDADNERRGRSLQTAADTLQVNRLMVTCCFSRLLMTSPLTNNFLALAQSAKRAKGLEEEGKQEARPKVALEGKGHIPKSLPSLRPATEPKVQ